MELLKYTHIESCFYQLSPELSMENRSFIYGEVDHKKIIEIIQEINSENVNTIANVCDLGSGCGKLIFHIANFFEEIACTGIEIDEQRSNYLHEVLELYEEKQYLTKHHIENLYNKIELIHGNFLTYYLGNYDFIYCCNIIFSDEDNKKLYRKISKEYSGFVLLFNYDYNLQPFLVRKYTINTSWEKKVPIYLLYIIK